MKSLSRVYVHLPIDAVDTVVFDAEGYFDGDRYDRYATFVEARDAALSSIEIMLDEADYDGDDHRAELEQMIAHLESSSSIEELESQAAYRRLLDRLSPVRTVAA
jgi:molybdenum cofactor biosynthesis enzyme MoaA